MIRSSFIENCIVRAGGFTSPASRATAVVNQNDPVIPFPDALRRADRQANGLQAVDAAHGQVVSNHNVSPALGDSVIDQQELFPIAEKKRRIGLFNLGPRISAGVFADGNWLLYASNLSGRIELYLRPFPGPGPVTQLTKDGVAGTYAWIGREIFFRQTLGGDQLMAVSVDTLPKPPGLPKPLFPIPSGLSVQDVARDGRVLFIKGGNLDRGWQARELYIVINWIEEVKQKLAEPVSTRKTSEPQIPR